MAIGLNTSRIVEVDPREALLERSREVLADMLKYHPCDHLYLDPCCCVCESKIVLRQIEDRRGTQ